MLNKKNSVASLAVSDIGAARKFYEGVLGFKAEREMEDQVVSYRSGDSTFNIYRSEFAGTNEATAMTWPVGDEIDSIAKELKSKGVKFERYDMPELKLDGDLYSGHGMKVGWFKDPDGNILNIVSG